MSGFTYGSSTLINITNHNASVDFDINGLPATFKDNIDLAVTGFANFISGNYVQDGADVNDISSTVTLDLAHLRNAAITEMNAAELTDSGATRVAYGTSVHNTFSSSVGSSLTGISNRSASTDTDFKTTFNTRHVLLNFQKSNMQTAANFKSGANLLKNTSGLGALMVEAASAALFKKLGKHAALSNDSTVSGGLMSQVSSLTSAIESALAETNANYSSSAMFRTYLNSGLYNDDGTDVGSSTSYTLDRSNYDFVIRFQGNVSDSSGTEINSTSVNRIFGDATTNETRVTANGKYSINVLLRLQQRDDL